MPHSQLNTIRQTIDRRLTQFQHMESTRKAAFAAASLHSKMLS